MNETPQSDQRPEVKLPGYTLLDRLGAGGYGEVWRASAPGGLTKAVKFVFGQYNEKRAANELKALEKVLGVRHPFLLSLERIEVLEDRLVIITEVADGSLKDRFDECVAEGEAGVPREELLGYLRDTADALDFLSQRHSLQHLDIKPENLLLLAGHVKVADFGLVKDLQNTQVSLVGGLTPLYAAPEVFQGRPSKHSDQYSLAVLYQEMLTGRLPFLGATAAELTLQHLNDEPNLSSLPESDRYLVARALAKETERRFATCSEFVKALSGQTSGWASQSSSVSSPPRETESVSNSSVETTPSPQPGMVTQVFDGSPNADSAKATSSTSMLLELPQRDEASVTTLPAVPVEPAKLDLRPTLILGIGGVGGKVLSRLRHQTAQRFPGAMPAVQMLLVDTDSRALARASSVGDPAALTNQETLSLPLRRPQEYRERADKIQRWLSRRWLYNIPRSLETEGLRPLGRLALVDHAQRTLQRLRHSLNAAIDPVAIETTSESLGFPIKPSDVRVIIVSSISGGTGGGMSLDLGYAVRHALERMGLAEAEVTGIFTHSLGSENRQSELAKVNAYSWLTELKQFSGENSSYPGDVGAGLPGFPAGVAPFDHTYLLRWQDGMNAEQFQASVDSLAEYVYLNVFSPAQQFFAASRVAESEHQAIALRSFNLERASVAESSLTEKLTAAVSQQVVLNWSGGVAGCASQRKWKPSALASQAPEESEHPISGTDTNQLVHGAAQLVSQSQLNLEGLSSATREVMKTCFEGKLERFYLKTLSTVEKAGTDIDIDSAKRIADELFSDLNVENFENAVRIMGDPVQRVVGPLGLKLAGELRRWVLERLDDRQERLPGAKRAVIWLSDHFEAVTRDAQRLVDRLGTQAAALTQEILASSEGKRSSAVSEQVLEKLLAYVRLRLDHASVLAARIISATLVAELKSLNETLVEFGRHLNHVAVAIQRNEEASEDGSSSLQPVDDCLDPAIKAILPELADHVDEIVHEGFLAENGGLLETVMSNSRVRAGLLATIRQRAQEVVRLQLQQRNLEDRLTKSAENQAETNKAAPPLTLGYGGSVRNLAVIPRQPSPESAATAFSQDTTVVTDANTEFSLCCEACNIPLVPLAVEIIDGRRDYAEYAARVHTRKDIDWQPLVAASAPSHVALWDSLCYNAAEEKTEGSAAQLV